MPSRSTSGKGLPASAACFICWSAAAHCGRKEDPVLTKDREWLSQVTSVGDWSKWLAEGDRPEQLEVLRQHVERGLPCGAEAFIRRLERRTGQLLRARSRGRPKKGKEQK